MRVRNVAAVPMSTFGTSGLLVDLLDGLHTVVQPIVDIASGATYAVEALARFDHAPSERADDVIATAHRAGYGAAVEAACIRSALERRDRKPANVYLTVNVSPDVLGHPAVTSCWPADLDGVIVEITEHRATDAAALEDRIADLRRRGAKIAVDDVGTGYAGLLRLATMRPDIVKIDRTIVSGVRDSDAQAAVLEALVTLSKRLNATVIGEGVECTEDIVAMAQFDVDYVQGFAIGLPAPTVRPTSPLVVAACQEARSSVLGRQAARPGSGGHDMHDAVSIMLSATRLADLHQAAAQAARNLGVDGLAVSTLGLDGMLREVTGARTYLDTRAYDPADYPLTRRVLRTGEAAEVHVSEPDADPAERRLLDALGHHSLLLVPLAVGERTVGVLEFFQRTHRRWSSKDITNGYTLAAHLGTALARIQD